LIFRAFISGALDPYRNLAIEEALLERGAPDGLSMGEGLLFFYVDDPCLVVGRNQNPWAEVSARASVDLPLLRRVSGGGTVYHDRGNLNWAFIVPRSGHDQETELALVAGALGKLGVAVESGPRGGLFAAGEGPYAGSKLSGTARRLAAARVLHHGTLLVDADLERMRASLGGIATEKSRALPSVGSPSVNLSSLLPGIGVDSLIRELAAAIAVSAPEVVDPYVDPCYVEASMSRLHSWEWTYGSTPGFSLVVDSRSGHVRLAIKSGRLAEVSGPGAEALVAFIGSEFDRALLDACRSTLQ
jgi:lipoate---protein ligase